MSVSASFTKAVFIASKVALSRATSRPKPPSADCMNASAVQSLWFTCDQKAPRYCPQDNTRRPRCRRGCVALGQQPVDHRGRASDSELPAPRFVGYCAPHFDHRHRTHRSLEQDCPQPRAVEPPGQDRIIELPLVADSTTATLVRRQLEPGFPFPGSGRNAVPDVPRMHPAVAPVSIFLCASQVSGLTPARSDPPISARPFRSRSDSGHRSSATAHTPR
jgi:hypothetical protein